MGGALGGIFSKTGQGDDFNQGTGNYDPSTAQKLVQGIAKGAGTSFGKSMQSGAPGGGGGSPSAPGASPVDSGYFAPTAMPPGTLAARPGAGPSPFYAQ